MSLEAIRYRNGKLDILNQLLIPSKTEYIPIAGTEDGWKAINTMQTRGAPAIAIVGCLSLVVEIYDKTFPSKESLRDEVAKKLAYLTSARPTAVNIKLAADHLTCLATRLAKDPEIAVDQMKSLWIQDVEAMLKKDISDNEAIGKHGASEILEKSEGQVAVLTHCNTGSLATAGYGTALGVIRALSSSGRLEKVYCTETRPYNQGARLTAYELVHEKIPGVLICDNMVAALMKSRKISAVLVGADRVAANGDTANKIGTYGIAVLAKHHKVPFYVCAPNTSIDGTLSSGDKIVIEERPAREMTHFGDIPIAAEGIGCWNPAFDVTPAELITGIVTETGVYAPGELLN